VRHIARAKGILGIWALAGRLQECR